MLTSSALPRLWRVCGALAVATATMMGAMAAHLPDSSFAAGGRAMAHSAVDMQMWQGNGTAFEWRPFYQYPAGWNVVR